MVTHIWIGGDRIMLTAYNPATSVSMLKCVYALLRISRDMAQVPEGEFRSWLDAQPGGPDLLARLEAGWEPPVDPQPSVDPRNAREESRIVAALMAEYRDQCGKVIKNKESLRAADS